MELIVGMCYNKPSPVWHEGITHGNWPYPSTPAVADIPIMFRVVLWTDFGVHTYERATKSNVFQSLPRIYTRHHTKP